MLPIFYAFINTPNVNEIIDEMSTSSVPIFDAVWPIVQIGLGIEVGFSIVLIIYLWISGRLNSLINKKDKYN